MSGAGRPGAAGAVATQSGHPKAGGQCDTQGKCGEKWDRVAQHWQLMAGGGHHSERSGERFKEEARGDLENDGGKFLHLPT